MRVYIVSLYLEYGTAMAMGVLVMEERLRLLPLWAG
jgi:hypothetical protein